MRQAETHPQDQGGEWFLDRVCAEHSRASRAEEENEAYLMTDMLTTVVQRGTAMRARELARPIAGKTGTSNAAKDTWFAGYSRRSRQ